MTDSPRHTSVYRRPNPADLPIAGPGGDTASVRAHLAEADPRTLLMSLTQLTRDATHLERFAVVCDPANAESGAEAEADEIRDLLADVLTDPSFAGDTAPIPTEFFQRLASTYVHETVDAEFVPLLLEQCGFDRLPGAPELLRPERPRPPEDFHVAVIGAGLSGICAGIKLAEAGYSYRIYDRNKDVGGTWLTNIYPGVGVDTPSHFYSYSFEITSDWPEFYSKGEYVLDYLRRCADGHGLRDHTVFETEVLACEFDETSARWRVVSRGPDGGEQTEWADAVVTAMGFFQGSVRPDIPGLADFAGTTVHTADWDPSIDLTGKRVAMVGTGASAMQVGPAIVDDVADLTVFQRTPSWVMPRRKDDLTVPAGARWAMRHVPYYGEWFRFFTYWFASDGNFVRVVVDPEWTAPGAVSEASEKMRQWLLAYAREELADRPDLFEKAIPSYPPFGKRILRDSNWYRMLRRDHVALVTSPIERVTPTGVVTADGVETPADVLILATGYKVLPMLDGIRITGRGGTALTDVWGDDDPRAHLGLTVPGFPNLFVLGGPNSAPNHGAGVNITAETQVHFVLACLGLLHESGVRTIEPRQDAHDAYNAEVEQALEQRVWSHPSVRSYYQNSKGRVVVSNPWRLVDYWTMLRSPDPADHILD
ncbi:flavin-containing monooxygenase [Yinghuangia seranimata]|uniref:flavin-containing monooxygenase n=1 Tax=Yinghuangia seranimata TaxID=408067 RepID=UPI00248D25B2|nr:NAD(P)/FAD-dependent oxidoreductase [Yinghuangia seranimata]MDI2129412.1 NAD(P)/FAD-dependent oxidoreductase [Yinghuangia seranimata]